MDIAIYTEGNLRLLQEFTRREGTAFLYTSDKEKNIASFAQRVKHYGQRWEGLAVRSYNSRYAVATRRRDAAHVQLLFGRRKNALA